jgi:hypothetical protein
VSRARTACRSAAALLLAAVLPACSTDVAFRVDDRLTFTSPEDRATVTLPVRLDWDVRDFTVLPSPSPGPARDDAGYFAVFVDRAPVPPGKPLAYLARKDNRCKRDPGCPDVQYLAALGVYTTTATELTISRLPRDSEHPDRRERHRAVVVLLDGAGKRIGESAYEIAFDVDRSPS